MERAQIFIRMLEPTAFFIELEPTSGFSNFSCFGKLPVVEPVWTITLDPNFQAAADLGATDWTPIFDSNY